MLDSSTKYPDGIAYGHTRHLGNFDECYNLQVNIMDENVNIHEINGKYCLVDIEYKNKYGTSIRRKPPISKYQDNFVNTNNSFWEMIEVCYIDPQRSQHNVTILVYHVDKTIYMNDNE